MEKFKFIEPVLIKAGSSQIKLGMFEEAPRADCRVLSEDAYQELKKAYDLVCESQKADTGEKQCNLPVVSGSCLIGYLEWRDSLYKENRGGKIMYDVRGEYKWLDDDELFECWKKRNNYR